MITFKRFIQISRPRFWIYLFGPYLIGIIAAQSSLYSLTALSMPQIATISLFALYFLLPANLLLYGINDVFDYETDKHNVKKQHYEQLLVPAQQQQVLLAIFTITIPFLLLSLFLPFWATVMLALFLCLSIFYSAPPIRAKTKPIFDSISNFLYILPGIVGYILAGGTNISLTILLAAGFWAMAMHAYSAIPDIDADKEAHLNTVATFLGKKSTLTFCTLLYVSSSFLAAIDLGILAYIFGLIYVWLMRKSYQADSQEKLLSIYAKFPITNTVIGFTITLTLLVKLLIRSF